SSFVNNQNILSPPEGVVDGILTRADHQQKCKANQKQQRFFLHTERVVGVRENNRCGHRDNNGNRREPRRQSQNDEDTAYELGKRGQYKGSGYAEPVRIDELNLISREEFRQFRNAVRKQQTRYQDTEKQQRKMSVVSGKVGVECSFHFSIWLKDDFTSTPQVH